MLTSITKVVVGVVCVVVLVIGVVDFANRVEVRRIRDTMDTRLLAKDSNKQVAINVLGILTIHNQSSYTEVRNKVFSNLSQDLRSAIFPGDRFTGVLSTRPNLIIHSVKSDFRDSLVHHFKVDLTLEHSGVAPQSAILIITVSNGVVVSIERI